MGFYPLVLDMDGTRCLIVGGGEVALRKARRLVEAGADVTVIAPDITAGLREMDGVKLVERSYRPGDVAGFSLVFAASDDVFINAAVSEEAVSRGVLVNAVDDPEKCTFLAAAVVQRGDLMIAVSTSGKSPMLCKRIREELEARYGPEYGEMLELMGELRPLVKAKYGKQSERESVFCRLVDCGILELLREGKREEARKKALECM